MIKITHSKYRNSGLIFEILIRTVSSDTLKGINSPAIDIIKKFFIKTELGKEYKLYETIMKSKSLNENKANVLIDTVLEESKKINRKCLKSLKYNLIKEINEHYNMNEFFNTKIKSYKELASIYTLIEVCNSVVIVDPQQTINHKTTLLEYITVSQNEILEEDNSIKEFKESDKDIRLLTYKILLEKFNNKYDDLDPKQKLVLKEFINSLDSTPQLRNFYNSKIKEIKTELLEEMKIINDDTTRIKLQEVSKYLVELDKNEKMDSNNIVDLLQYYDLINEIKLSYNV